jgi:hypothetical protein
MASRVENAAAGALVNCVDSAHASEIDTRGLMRAAVEMSRCKHETVARAIGRQPDYWSRILSGERGITLQEFGRVPLEVQREFLSLWARAIGGRFVDNSSEAQALAALAQKAIEALSGGFR